MTWDRHKRICRDDCNAPRWTTQEVYGAVDHTGMEREWMQVSKVTQSWDSYLLKKLDFLHEGIAGELKTLVSKVPAVSA